MSESNSSSTELPLQASLQPSASVEAAVVHVGANYVHLVRFLISPFLDAPELLKVDCETSPRTMRVLIRLAVEGDDKGRMLGRGGRNVQAVRAVVQAVAQAAGHLVHLEVFGIQAESQRGEQEDDRPAHLPVPRRPPQPRVDRS